MSDFYVATQRKARKDHICDLCATKILKGQEYINAAGMYEGDFFSHKLHMLCDNHINMYLEKTGYGEFSFSEVNEWLYENYCFECYHHDESNDCMLDSDPAYCGRFIPKVKEAQGDTDSC